MTQAMAAARTTHILYLHGFRSSPKSAKAQYMGAWMRAHLPDVHWACPQLPPSPKEAMALVAERLAAWPIERMAVVGSSLGGFYATVVAEGTGCPAVVLNPAINPARDLAGHIGDLTSYDQTYSPMSPSRVRRNTLRGAFAGRRVSFTERSTG